MGLFDKLKDVGKDALKASGVTITKLPDELADDKNATFIEKEDFIKHGSISGGDLPAAKGVMLYFTIDAETDELIVVFRVEKMLSCKYKLIRKIPLKDIVAFRAVKTDHLPLSNGSTLHSYYSTITTADGQSYELYQGWTQRSGPDHTSMSIQEEMDTNIGLNAVLLSFLSLVNDDFTKQWYNDISAERGLQPAFDENGEMDVDKYLESHTAWFKTKSEEWINRMKAVSV